MFHPIFSIINLTTTPLKKGEFDTELSETADDVSKTLSVAVQLLADLMTFNKIEGNINYTLTPTLSLTHCSITLSHTPKLTVLILSDDTGGLMKLHKQLINVQEHIQDVVDTVAAEAREKGKP